MSLASRFGLRDDQARLLNDLNVMGSNPGSAGSFLQEIFFKVLIVSEYSVKNRFLNVVYV